MRHKTEKISITELVNSSGCFDLQFRKDTRHERTGSPTYYRWKTQFIITLQKSKIKTLQKVAHTLGCGNVTTVGNQSRFSVQNIDEISNVVIPYFTKHPLAGDPPSHEASARQGKKKDFSVWQKAAVIVHKNKGKKISMWGKNDLASLVELHKLSKQYKGTIKTGKWMDMAKMLTKKTA